MGPFVDTLLDDDAIRPGRIYIAESTVTTMAGFFGMATADWAEAALESIKALEAALEETKKELARERELNQALINARADKEPSHAA